MKFIGFKMDVNLKKSCVYFVIELLTLQVNILY